MSTSRRFSIGWPVKMMRCGWAVLSLMTLVSGLVFNAQAQRDSKPTPQYDPSLYKALEWRSIGPFSLLSVTASRAPLTGIGRRHTAE